MAARSGWAPDERRREQIAPRLWPLSRRPPRAPNRPFCLSFGGPACCGRSNERGRRQQWRSSGRRNWRPLGTSFRPPRSSRRGASAAGGDVRRRVGRESICSGRARPANRFTQLVAPRVAAGEMRHSGCISRLACALMAAGSPGRHSRLGAPPAAPETGGAARECPRRRPAAAATTACGRPARLMRVHWSNSGRADAHADV